MMAVMASSMMAVCVVGGVVGESGGERATGFDLIPTPDTPITSFLGLQSSSKRLLLLSHPRNRT